MKIRGQAYGTEAQIASYTGSTEAPGQFVWSTDGHRMYVMDGSTPGGYKVAMVADLSSYVPNTTFTSYQSTVNTQLGQKVAKSGARGNLAGYEALTSSGAAVTITQTSPDDTAVTGAVGITVNNGSAGTTWTKTVGITNASATVTLGSSWKWSGGEQPTVKANAVLVLKWYGTFGFAALQNSQA